MNNVQFLRKIVKQSAFFGFIFSLLFSGMANFAQQGDGLATMRERARELAAQRAAEGKRKIRTVGTMKFGDAERLRRAKEKQADKYLIKDLSDREIAERTVSDFFTQSEGHLQVEEVISKMKAQPSKMFIPYLNIIADALQKEAELKDTHYVFYHASDNVWRTPQDLYTKLYAYKNPSKTIKDFIFLRFAGENVRKNAQNFIIDQIKKYGLPDDTNVHTKPYILSVNPSIMGNVGFSGECTWNYFMEEKSHREPDSDIFKKILDTFGISHKYVHELMSLFKIYKTDEQSLLQIFLPKEKVDQIAYMSWVMGIPPYLPLVDAIEKQIAGKPRIGQTFFPVIRAIVDSYKSDGNIDPYYKDFLASVKPMREIILQKAQQGAYKVTPFIKTMRNNPWSLKGVNDYSVRLLFTSDVLLNPASGVKIYRHTTTSREKQAEYEQTLDRIVKKLSSGG